MGACRPSSSSTTSPRSPTTSPVPAAGRVRGRRRADGDAALAQVRAADPDLVVLDVLLPGMDGRAVLRQVREERRSVPIILLTQVGESGERAMALEEGADDYLNKPFDPHELVARIRAVLRRRRPAGPGLGTAQRLRSGPCVLDRASQRVFRNGAEVILTPRATVLLAYFMTHPDEVMTRERLLEAVWGWAFPAGHALRGHPGGRAAPGAGGGPGQPRS